MGHIGQNALEALPKATTGGNASPEGLKCKDCETCIQAKATVKVSRQSPERSTEYLEKVYSDICGPISPETWTKKRYFTTFIDDKSRFAEVALLRTKDQVFEEYKTWQVREERQTGLRVKRLHTDNAREYKSQDFQNHHREQGVLGTYTAPYTPAQNGVGERINRTIIEKVRSMLIGAKLPKAYWGEAVLAATYLYNRTLNSSIGFKTPYEAKTGRIPDISNIRTWGSVAYRVMPEIGRKKLDPKAKAYILVGYGSNQYKLLDPSTRKTIWCRDAYIVEGRYLNDKDQSDQLIIQESEEPIVGIGDLYGVQPGDTSPPLSIDQLAEPSTGNREQLVNEHPNSESTENDREQLDESKNSPNTYNDLISQLQQYVDNDVTMETAIPAIHSPATYREAISSQKAAKWIKAMETELNELNRHKTWELVPLPPGRQAIPGRWVYAIKPTEPEPTFKARWVAKGFRQQPGLDFNETYANTVNPVVYRLVLALAALEDWEIHQWDVKSAFPNADIREEIYVKQPTGFEAKGREQLVCRLYKALYGLKQSAREWEITLREALSALDLRPTQIDQSVYLSVKGAPIILITHVDDILAISPKKARISEIYNRLNNRFILKDLGEAKTFLGIELLRDRPNRSIRLHQTTYTRRILEKYQPKLKPLRASERAIPMSVGQEIGPYDQQQSPELINQYQQEIGSILYLTTKTRPDIAYVTGVLSRYMANPGPEHFQALEKLWKYLAAQPDLGLNYHSQSPRLVGYCDSDWGGDKGNRRSTTGYIYLFRGTPISWSSKLQKTVALSSCEAEYMALKEAIKEQQYLKAIGTSIPFLPGLLHPEDLYTDSQSAISLAKNPGHHQRTKHIDIQYHYVREQVQLGATSLIYVPTGEQLADYLTKPTAATKWIDFIQNIGLQGLNGQKERPVNSLL